MDHQDEIVAPARTVTDRGRQHFVVLVANAKGGCGKTTLSTSLASYYASQGRSVTLLDLDPQQSSSQWWRQRTQQGYPAIDLQTVPLDGHFHAGRLQASLREARDMVIIDSPAGLSGPALDALLNISKVVLVPVLPSPIDIRAATRFLQAVMLSPVSRRRPRRLAVIANRARERTRMYGQLEVFLNSLKIPFLTTLRDTQLYVQASGEGCGILDLPDIPPQDRDSWRRVMEWLEVQRHLTRTLPGL
ncbi:MAG: ParA family protein [Gammaproteobacteria bacterium HGW-Gammaproteobacteria-14]|nr:MAG: ParA family protein [Gammaproteobacteria bacterium HGW-Gammaproteobacteria-14]